MAPAANRKLAPHWALVVLVGLVAVGSGVPSLQLGSNSNEDQVCTSLLDIVLVIDESGSIGTSNYAKVRAFLSDFFTSMPVSEDDVHIALLTYSSNVADRWDLKAAESRSSSLGSAAALNLPYRGGLTYTDQGLDRAYEYLFSGKGARDEAPKLVLLMTDGGSNERTKTQQSAKKLRERGVIVVVLGVGSGVNDTECRGVAGCETSTCDRYLRTDWSSVTSQVQSIIKAACIDLAKDAICSEWSDYGPCEGKCGQEGVRTSTRIELSPARDGTPTCATCEPPKGRSCADQPPGLSRTTPCTMPACVVDAHCGDFGEWSPWSGTCGTVSRSREREGYNNPPASGGGLSCEEQRPPKLQTEVETVDKSPCPVQQEPGPWGEWSSCSKTCGVGKRSRTRTGIPQEGELYGGQTLLEQGIPVREEETCNEDPCPIDATCGDWTPFSECSKSCGGGTQERHREPWLDNAEHGGRTCSEQHPEGPTEVRECNQHPCPVDEIPGEWGGWGPCSEQCGPGTQTRYRGESPQKAMYGGKTIEEQNKDLPEEQKILLEETRSCENNPCGPCTLPFAEWSACSACEGSRTRHTMVVFDYYDGKCELPTVETESCVGDCPVTPPDEGEDNNDDKEESQGVPTAAIAGGIVGGLVLLGAAGGGAAYAMGGGGAAEAGPSGETEVSADEAESSLLQEEKETLVAPGEQTEMWA